jgi:hypothetical protein
VTTIPQEKFDKKTIIWQAICTCGKKASPFFTMRSFNANIYKKECLKECLWPFITSHECSTLFWPDLASCHYQKDVLKWLNEKEVDFVSKDINPQNCPQLRPIEIDWPKMKGLLKKNYKGACDMEELKSYLKVFGRTMKNESKKNLMEHVIKKVRNFTKFKD